LRSAAVDADLRQPEADLLLDARDPDLVELVEVGAEDRQEAQPLEQRQAAVLRLFEHPPVELELAQLAVEVETGG
jgi:hypothetical protein